MFAFLVGLLIGWRVEDEIKKNRDFQQQLLDRLEAPAEEQNPNSPDITIEVEADTLTSANGVPVCDITW